MINSSFGRNNRSRIEYNLENKNGLLTLYWGNFATAGGPIGWILPCNDDFFVKINFGGEDDIIQMMLAIKICAIGKKHAFTNKHGVYIFFEPDIENKGGIIVQMGGLKGIGHLDKTEIELLQLILNDLVIKHGYTLTQIEQKLTI